MPETGASNVVRARMLANPLFGRPEVTTGGSVSFLRRDQGGPDLVIVAGYSAMPAHCESTLVFDMSGVTLETFVQYQMMANPLALGLAPAAAMPVSLRARLNRIKAAFGLSTKELASVMQCSRAALYNWLDESYTGQVREEALLRLSSLERLSGRWNAYEAGNLAAHLHASIVEHPDGHRGDVFSLLTQDEIDEDRAAAALQAIATLSRQQVAEFRRVDELTARGFGQ